MLTEVTTSLRLLAVIAGDKALGYRGAAIVSALNGVAALAERGQEGRGEMKKLNGVLQRMVDTKQEPTKAEFASLKALSDQAHDTIQEPLVGGADQPDHLTKVLAQGVPSDEKE